MNTPLLDALHHQAQQPYHRFHVPGHAGQALAPAFAQVAQNLFAYDLTELPALDVLGNPQGVLRDSQATVARQFGTLVSFYLINGASTGIMAALLACGLQEGHHVLVARNCHRCVIHGLILSGATPHWLLPQVESDWGLWGAVNPMTLETTLENHPEIRAFVMTHPTYEGILSDMATIWDLCKRYGVYLIVDEAHGSLWPLSADFPASALEAGADAVIHSLHKSGGSLTQTALLHLPFSSRLEAAVVQEALNTLQTTSPSYLLLASLEATCAIWASPQGQDTLKTHAQRVHTLCIWMDTTLKTLRRRASIPNKASLQLFVSSSRLSGEALAACLEERYGIAYEALTPTGVLLLLNPGLSDGAFTDLKAALQAMDVESQGLPPYQHIPMSFAMPQMALAPRQAFFSPGQTLAKAHAVGRIAKQVIATCPPGIPVIVPGEIIAAHHIPYLPDAVQVVL